MIAPETFDGFADALGQAAVEGRRVEIRGAGTKRACGRPDADVDLSTAGLNRIYAHDADDRTAVLGAGTPLVEVREALASKGQRLALDPPLGHADAATVGGVFATGDSGPLRHRYGTPRDRIIGLSAALSDGSVIRTGAPVVTNGAGYDFGKLFCGAFGTLGVILAVAVRLEPIPERTATVTGSSDSPGGLAAAATALAAASLELEALDVRWEAGSGSLAAQVAGSQARPVSKRVAAVMRQAGLDSVETAHEDAALWARQRAEQRSADHALVRVDARPSDLAQILALTANLGARTVARGALGCAYLELSPGAVEPLRARLPPGAQASLLDAPAGTTAPRWDVTDGPELALMRSVKQNLDPAGVCNPGVYVGGI